MYKVTKQAEMPIASILFLICTSEYTDMTANINAHANSRDIYLKERVLHTDVLIIKISPDTTLILLSLISKRSITRIKPIANIANAAREEIGSGLSQNLALSMYRCSHLPSTSSQFPV